MLPSAGYTLLFLLTGSIAGAQAPPSGIQAGDTVRVWATSPSLKAVRGVVVRQGSDSVTFAIRSAVSRTSLDTPVPNMNLTRLDLFEGRRRSRKRTAIGWTVGAVVGLGAGGYIAWAASPLHCNTTPCNSSVSSDDALASILGIGIGAIGGAAIGSAAGWWIGGRPVDHWRRVHP